MPQLLRHPGSECQALRSLSVEVERSRVRFVLEGEIERLRIPEPRTPRIAERLWQHSCCELFIGRRGEPPYHEFNFSPSGEWAGYAFSRYREGALLRDNALDPRIAVKRHAARLDLEAHINLQLSGTLRVGVAAVIEDQHGALSYWALRHAPGKPDFHHPDSFVLELDEARD